MKKLKGKQQRHSREICLLLCVILIVFNSYKIFFQSKYLSTKVVSKQEIIYVSEISNNGGGISSNNNDTTNTTTTNFTNNNNNNNIVNMVGRHSRSSSTSSIGNNNRTTTRGHHHHHHHLLIVDNNKATNTNTNNIDILQKQKNFTTTSSLGGNRGMMNNNVSTTLLFPPPQPPSVTQKQRQIQLQLKLQQQEQQQEQDSSSSSSSSSLSSNNDKYRLELLHIPKTGGTFLEIAAATNNVVWGACHFDFNWKRRKLNPLNICPEIDERTCVNVNTKHVLWHYPLQSWPNITNTNTTNTNKDSNNNTNTTTDDDSNNMKMMPLYHKGYDALLDKDLKSKPKRFFVVIRNPYDKIISLYYMRGPKKPPNQINNPFVFNKWIQDKIHQELNQFCYESCGMTPQYQYVYDSNSGNKRMVHHILRLEHLSEDFDKELRQRYNFLSDFVIPSEKMNVGSTSSSHNHNRNKNNKLDPSYFNNQTLQLINDVYGKDFILGNYTKLSWEDILLLNKQRKKI